MGSILANSYAPNVPSFRRWRFEMKLSPFFLQGYYKLSEFYASCSKLYFEGYIQIIDKKLEEFILQR